MKMLGKGSGLPEILRAPGMDQDYTDQLLKRIEELEEMLAVGKQQHRELGAKFNQLQGWYAKLADQWNAFQAVHRPTNRNVQRAEAVGEFARRQVDAILRMTDEEQRTTLIRLLIQSAYPAEEFSLEQVR